jgi:DNA-binding CsgD family transcriptional regulator
MVGYASASLGFLELGYGRVETAIRHLDQVARAMERQGVGEPAAVQWAPDLIEALVRAGRTEQAEHALGALERQALATGRTWALAAAARCRGLLAGEEGYEPELREALAWHEQTPTPFERARTELCLGERCRRTRRRAEARLWLHAALETFERLGAEPWAERARQELVASGEQAPRRAVPGAHELTPQELQVALVVARGATNREAAAALFLSPKTIETHLGRVYRKLQVRSRTELARRLASEAEAAV